MLLWSRYRQGPKGCPDRGSQLRRAPKRSDHNDVRALTEDGQELLHQKKRTAHIRCKEIVKVLDRMILDGCSLGNAGVGHEHIQSLADN
jgi:hypothetical protein